MATTTNFGWTTPDDTALVKDGASAIRSLGSAIDASMAELKGGTTGQVLSKTSNTDMDFTWVAQDDSNAIQNALLTTTGDTIYASGASTPARLGIGTTGQVLTVSAGGVPSWATTSSGGMTLLSTTTLTGASVTLSSIPQTYNDLHLVVRNYRPATDGTRLELRINADSTANRHQTYDTFGPQASGFTRTTIEISGAADNGSSSSLINAIIWDYTNTATWKAVFMTGIVNNETTATNGTAYISHGFYNQTSAISSLVLIPNSGNFTSGTALLYGVK